jgi:hypothetical protein
LVFVLSWSSSAEATPIVVNAGQTVTFNFDFFQSGAVPAPPYPHSEFATGLVLATLDGGDVGSWSFFGGLDGTGGFLSGFGGAGMFTFSDPGFSDGIFSAVLTLTGGSITIDPFAYGLNASFVNVTGSIAPLGSGPAPVPEPATLTLLGSGLAAAAWRRRRTRA